MALVPGALLLPRSPTAWAGCHLHKADLIHVLSNTSTMVSEMTVQGLVMSCCSVCLQGLRGSNFKCEENGLGKKVTSFGKFRKAINTVPANGSHTQWLTMALGGGKDSHWHAGPFPTTHRWTALPAPPSRCTHAQFRQDGQHLLSFLGSLSVPRHAGWEPIFPGCCPASSPASLLERPAQLRPLSSLK